MAGPPPLDLILGLAFGAGALAFFSPCSVAMLPAYLAYFLGGATRPGEESPRALTVAANGGGPRWVAPASALSFVAAGTLLLFALVNSLRQNTLGFARSEVAFSLSGLVLFAVGIATLAYGLNKGVRFGEVREGLLRGLVIGAVTSLGIATVLGSLGLSVLGGASFIQAYLPGVVVATAVVIIALGSLMILGRSPSLIPAVRAPRGRGYLSFYTLGLGYALVSTGCNLPVFLLVVGLALQAAAASWVSAFLVLLAYTGGSSLVLILLTTYLAVAHRSTFPWLSRILPYAERVGGGVVVAMGAYILWYDYTFVLARP